MSSIERQGLAREWFYEFILPSGAVTKTKVPAEVLEIHTTRLRMMWQAVEAAFGEDIAEITAIDTASHEGFFSMHLAQRCASVRGLEVNPTHVAAAALMQRVYGLSNLKFSETDLSLLDVSTIMPADLVLAFGLIYHLENPVGVLRKLRSLTRRMLLIETQTVMLDLCGDIDWGHHLSQIPLRGVFGIVDEVPGAPEGGTSTISLVPSRNGVIWLLRHLGFRRVEILTPPAGAYPQLVTGRRIMVAAHL
jgi:tRNA (mo5U34)-methyltransferase